MKSHGTGTVRANINALRNALMGYVPVQHKCPRCGMIFETEASTRIAAMTAIWAICPECLEFPNPYGKPLAKVKVLKV